MGKPCQSQVAARELDAVVEERVTVLGEAADFRARNVTSWPK